MTQPTARSSTVATPCPAKFAAGCILALPCSRGSSTTTAVLLEAILCETAPAAIITAQVDSFFALKAIVAQELYGHCLPLIGLSPAEFAQIENGRWAIVENGIVQMEESIHA